MSTFEEAVDIVSNKMNKTLSNDELKEVYTNYTYICSIQYSYLQSYNTYAMLELWVKIVQVHELLLPYLLHCLSISHNLKSTYSSLHFVIYQISLAKWEGFFFLDLHSLKKITFLTIQSLTNLCFLNFRGSTSRFL